LKALCQAELADAGPLAWQFVKMANCGERKKKTLVADEKKEQKNSGLKKQTGAKICLRNCF
jgi:hypothetical protein